MTKHFTDDYSLRSDQLGVSVLTANEVMHCLCREILIKGQFDTIPIQLIVDLALGLLNSTITALGHVDSTRHVFPTVKDCALGVSGHFDHSREENSQIQHKSSRSCD